MPFLLCSELSPLHVFTDSNRIGENGLLTFLISFLIGLERTFDPAGEKSDILLMLPKILPFTTDCQTPEL
jgi:hypothetical protein